MYLLSSSSYIHIYTVHYIYKCGTTTYLIIKSFVVIDIIRTCTCKQLLDRIVERDSATYPESNNTTQIALYSFTYHIHAYKY